MGTFSIWHWLVVLLVVVLVFGSKKLVNVGPDLGKAIRGFQKSMRDGAKADDDADANAAEAGKTALEADGSQAEAPAARSEKTASS